MEEQQSPVKVLKPITATLFSGDIIRICVEEDETIGKASKIKNLEINEVEFIAKNQFKQSDNCNVCNIFVSEPQNCYVCGSTCCQPCSRKSLNSKTVCDLCFFRVFMRSYNDRQKQILDSKQNQSNQLKQQTQEVQKNIAESKKFIADIDKDYSTNTNTKNQIQESDQQIQILQETFDIKNQKYEDLLQKQDELTKELETSLNTLSNQQYLQTTLGLDLQSVETSYGQKEQTFNSLSKQQKKIINSKSYLNCMNSTKNTDPAGNQLHQNPARPSYDADEFYKQGSITSSQTYNQKRQEMANDNNKLLSEVTEASEFPEKVSLMQRESDHQAEEQAEKCCCQIF